MPEFGKVSVEGALLCKACHMSSNDYAIEILGCVKCHYQERQCRSDGRESIEPQFCDFCNP